MLPHDQRSINAGCELFTTPMVALDARAQIGGACPTSIRKAGFAGLMAMSPATSAVTAVSALSLLGRRFPYP
jgi:hypothetical protein